MNLFIFIFKYCNCYLNDLTATQASHLKAWTRASAWIITKHSGARQPFACVSTKLSGVVGVVFIIATSQVTCLYICLMIEAFSCDVHLFVPFIQFSKRSTPVFCVVGQQKLSDYCWPAIAGNMYSETKSVQGKHFHNKLNTFSRFD